MSQLNTKPISIKYKTTDSDPHVIASVLIGNLTNISIKLLGHNKDIGIYTNIIATYKKVNGCIYAVGNPSIILQRDDNNFNCFLEKNELCIDICVNGINTTNWKGIVEITEI
jgi:hypothetical protein